MQDTTCSNRNKLNKYRFRKEEGKNGSLGETWELCGKLQYTTEEKVR